jgi:adenosylcobinamide-phosphate synthase
MRITPWEIIAGAGLDLAIGDPQWIWHPVRGLGHLISFSERIWRATGLPPRLAGALFWLTVTGVAVAVVWITIPWGNIYWIYSLLAGRDLDVEAGRVVHALERGDIEESRKKLSRIVGRDTATLNQREILRATVETVAENLSDGVIAPLLYLAVAGPVGMAAYKAVNTLDSMVGYRDERYREFGWASARMDDLANFIPARITAVLICISALLPNFDARRAIRVTARDAARQPSPNAGYPEAAFAGALGVQLGGLNYYNGQPAPKPLLGDAIVPLECRVFPRVRTLLYASEGIFIAIILGCMRW